MTSRADALLAGPRGRRLCLQIVVAGAGPWGWPPLTWRQGVSGYPVGRVEALEVHASLAAQVAATDLSSIGRADVLQALVTSVDGAMYWQPPDDADQLLADPALAALLAPVAETVTAAPDTRWWADPLARSDQHAVAWPAGDPPRYTSPQTAGVHAALRDWRTDTGADERRAAADRPRDLDALLSGRWWCTPATSAVVVTSRRIPGVADLDGQELPAPAGLVLVEDGWGWATARSWPVPVPAGARVHEVTGPDDWAALVGRHPLPATASRRHDWYRTTGQDADWILPDWSSMAEEFDAVHLTVDGYLSTVGRALPVPGTAAHTVLAGAAPDATWWLTDLPELREPTHWRRLDDDPPHWAPI
ncbi:hypothetical protein GCU67_14815 [Modestobacter muralis]|uniref:Uncharacterized protein n=1 Tax=Modestobacter muralis TaxID=1608614 RepID=A0A6P0HA60_9ACTN|nr:hypothetical protein [Modestobacter muralis]NEK95427.1 hypothetical protein [Modestobacter muralis]NEN52315.1 hypothetical protein [Modestobacter muralis]